MNMKWTKKLFVIAAFAVCAGAVRAMDADKSKKKLEKQEAQKLIDVYMMQYTSNSFKESVTALLTGESSTGESVSAHKSFLSTQAKNLARQKDFAKRLADPRLASFGQGHMYGNVNEDWKKNLCCICKRM